MSKQNYAVCCYTCEHNGQETCKGCNTILNASNEPYENWQLREDLCQKDEQIADLQHRLEVANKMGRDAEKENQQLKALLKATEVTDIHNELADLQINNEWLESENQQIKQQLHELPKKIVCEISETIERLSWRKRIYTNWEFDKEQLYKDLDTILKKYGGEDE